MSHSASPHLPAAPSFPFSLSACGCFIVLLLGLFPSCKNQQNHGTLAGTGQSRNVSKFGSSFFLFEPAVGCLQDDLSILLFFSWGTPHTLCGSIMLSCLSVYLSKGNVVCSFGVCLWARVILLSVPWGCEKMGQMSLLPAVDSRSRAL